MKKVFWMTSEGSCAEPWQHFNHYETLVEDLTGFSLKESLCTETIKYMAKRLNDTPYQRRFKSLYTIYENEYQALVEKFNNMADSNRMIGIK
jgi:hypothetical protein